MTIRRESLTSAVLLFFGVWDAALAVAAIALPHVWFDIFHGVTPVDPQGLLARTGAVWAAFAVFHLIAWRVWQARLHWLVIVGGMRLSEIFADVTYLLSAADITTAGTIGLLIATPTNLMVGIFLIRTFVLRSGRGPAGE
jgi:hypothetical protein